MRAFVPYIFVFITAYLFLVIVSPYNLGITPDSINYIELARNFSLGNGLTIEGKFINHWPPFYPILLGATSKILNIDILICGQYLNFIFLLFFGFIYIKILREFNFHRVLVNILPVLLLLSLPLTVSLFFWSELAFLTILMGSFLFIIKWLKNRKTINLIFAGVLSGMMLMTRYAGVGFIGGFVISLFFISNSKTYKIRCLLSYITPIVLIFVLWYLYAKSFASSSVDRELIFHPVSLGKIIRSILVMLHWFVKDIFSLVTFMVMILISSYYLKKNYNYFLVYINKFLPFARVLIIVIISYYLFLLVSISFFDYYTKLDTRVLSPVFPMTLILIGIVFNFFIIKINNNFIFSLLTILLAFNIFYS